LLIAERARGGRERGEGDGGKRVRWECFRTPRGRQRRAAEKVEVWVTEGVEDVDEVVMAICDGYWLFEARSICVTCVLRWRVAFPSDIPEKSGFERRSRTGA